VGISEIAGLAADLHLRLEAAGLLRISSTASLDSPPTAVRMGSMLRGRETEQAAIDTFLQRARDGHGGGLVLRGEPGVGKSALLAYARGQATGMGVLATAGVEPEAELGYATLHRLLLPVLDRLDRLPEPQAGALRVVFAQRQGPVPDRFLVALATLSLLSELADDRPLLCLVDDAHWADRASLDALGFVARRLDAEPIAMMLAARTATGISEAAAGLADLPLTGLPPEAARALLREHGGDRLTPANQDELLSASGGNPLAIAEFAALTRHPVGGGEPLPLADRLQRAFLEQAGRQPATVQRLLQLIAADGSGRQDVLGRAAVALGLETASLEVDELDELVTRDGSGVAFRHPLIRSAVYHGASPAQRRDAHRALAAALAGEPTELERRAWHLAHAAEGPDEQVAAELERSAAQTMRRSGPAAAAAALGRAAELSPSSIGRARRLVAAAAAWLDAGDIARATVLLDTAEITDQSTGGLRRDIAELRALIELRAGTPAEAVALLEAVLPDAVAAEGDRARAVRLLLLLGEAGILAGVPSVWVEIATAAQRLPAHDSGTDDALLRLLGAFADALGGADPKLAAGALEALEPLTEPATLARVAGMAWGLGHHHLARRLRSKAVRLARKQGAAGSLAWVLLSVVTDNLEAGRFGIAEADAEEGHRLAIETGQPNTACRHQSLLALVAAHRGRELQGRELAEHALVAATARDLPDAAVWAHHALGLLDLVAGRSAEALSHLEAMRRRTAPFGIVLDAVPDLVEAAARAGEPVRAAEPLAQFHAWATTTNAPELQALAARCRALLATGDAATTEFEAALELHMLANRPMDQARTQLLIGEHLRRARRRAAARQQLRAAVAAFARLDAAAWAERARAELRAAGEATPRPALKRLAGLTPQELRVAVAVSEGAPNRQIAAQLFLSPRTVDYHLRKVFQKTGIASRAELVRLVLAEQDA
jgi:DNA-binding CsgD family transcriptional regulator